MRNNKIDRSLDYKVFAFCFLNPFVVWWFFAFYRNPVDSIAAFAYGVFVWFFIFIILCVHKSRSFWREVFYVFVCSLFMSILWLWISQLIFSDVFVNFRSWLEGVEMYVILGLAAPFVWVNVIYCVVLYICEFKRATANLIDR
jgi:hypothetical protein